MIDTPLGPLDPSDPAAVTEMFLRAVHEAEQGMQALTASVERLREIVAFLRELGLDPRPVVEAYLDTFGKVEASLRRLL